MQQMSTAFCGDSSGAATGMRGSRIPNPISDLTRFATAPVVAALLYASPAEAETNLVAPPLGQPIVLFLPRPFAEPTPAAPVHTAASAPAKKSKQLIPPSPGPAKLGPPPDPRPPMPLEIDLQPPAPAAQTAPAGTTTPSADKLPPG